MRNYKYIRNLNTKFSIKGEVSVDGTYITYVDGDKVENTITIADIFKPFKGETLDLSLTIKEEQDLTDEFEEEEG